MTEPRFKVTSVTGFGCEGGMNSREGTVSQVLDSAYCFELVYETTSRLAAERCATAMNEGDFGFPGRIARRNRLTRERQARYRAA